MVSTDRSGTPIGMSWYVPGAWRPPPHAPHTPKYYLNQLFIMF